MIFTITTICGLPETTITTMHTILKKYPNVEKAILYGSRAKGDYKNGSDIDLTFIGENINYDDLVHIAGEFDESNIIYTVDVSIFNDIDNLALRDHIHRVGMVFYERDI